MKKKQHSKDQNFILIENKWCIMKTIKVNLLHDHKRRSKSMALGNNPNPLTFYNYIKDVKF